jgi:hypothetical protein
VKKMSNSTVSILYKKLARLSLVFFTVAECKALKTPFLARLPFIPHQIRDYGVGIPVELAKEKLPSTQNAVSLTSFVPKGKTPNTLQGEPA